MNLEGLEPGRGCPGVTPTTLLWGSVGSLDPALMTAQLQAPEMQSREQ